MASTQGPSVGGEDRFVSKKDFVELSKAVSEGLARIRDNQQSTQQSYSYNNTPPMYQIRPPSAMITSPEIANAALKLPKDELMLVTATKEQEWLAILANMVESSTSVSDRMKILVYMKARIIYSNAADAVGHDTALKMFDAFGASSFMTMTLDPEAQSRLNRLMGIRQQGPQPMHDMSAYLPQTSPYTPMNQSPIGSSWTQYQPGTMNSVQQQYPTSSMSSMNQGMINNNMQQMGGYPYGSSQQCFPSTEIECYACHKKGHRVPECPDKDAVARYNAKKAATAAARSPHFVTAPPMSTYYPPYSSSTISSNIPVGSPAPLNAGNVA